MTHSHEHKRPARRRFGLQTRVIGFLLVISVVPLVVAGVLLAQSSRVALNFASNENAFLRPALERSQMVYIELIQSRRDLYYPQVALRIAALPSVVDLANGQFSAHEPAGPVPGRSASDIAKEVDQLLAETHELIGIAVRDGTGTTLIDRRIDPPAELSREDWREITLDQPVPDTDSTLQLRFAADPHIQRDYNALSQTLEKSKRIDEVRKALPSSYRMAFLVLVGGVVLLVSAIGFWLGRRFTRRFGALVSGTRRVGAGDMQARVELNGRDELAELARAFNRMVEELEHEREQIAYLQRVGAWQDVARKLAHEIKNPLTPIQLAMQQCVSSYKGEDGRFKRLLGDAEEIVTEEIANLRRLVDAFRTLGQLPRVAAKPLTLAGVVEDLQKDPMLIDHLSLEPPPDPVMIRGDRLLLRRVLTNLVENGIHAGKGAGSDGRVLVRWRADRVEERVTLTVNDEGPGVPEERRDKIFEPYITHKEEGTGLGLTISKKIALEHGGSLSLARERSSLGGACFVLVLPIVNEDEDENQDESADDRVGAAR